MFTIAIYKKDGAWQLTPTKYYDEKVYVEWPGYDYEKDFTEVTLEELVKLHEVNKFGMQGMHGLKDHAYCNIPMSTTTEEAEELIANPACIRKPEKYFKRYYFTVEDCD